MIGVCTRVHECMCMLADVYSCACVLAVCVSARSRVKQSALIRRTIAQASTAAGSEEEENDAIELAACTKPHESDLKRPRDDDAVQDERAVSGFKTAGYERSGSSPLGPTDFSSYQSCPIPPHYAHGSWYLRDITAEAPSLRG
jgi:hypothetical protein